MGRDELQSVAEYLGLTLVFVCVCVWGEGGGGVGCAAGGGGLIAIFRSVFYRTGRIFILAGRAGYWVIILWGLDTFLMLPNFLKS